jgi:integrase
MARIIVRQGKTGPRYTAQIRTGSHSESRTFSTKTAAKDWAKRREVELKEQPHLAATEAHKRTLGDAIDRYLQTVLPTLSETAQRDRPPLLEWWRKHYGDITLAMFQAPSIVEARDKLAATPKKSGNDTLAPATVNKYLLFLSHLLTTAAKEWHWIPASPMEGVRLLKVDNARTRSLSNKGEHSELNRLLEACRISESEHLYPFVMLSLITAGRRSELLDLDWSHVDLDKRTVTFANTKNGDTRTVSIPAEVADLLRPRRGIGKALVFPGRKDPSKPIDIDSAWKTAIRRARIEDFTIHSLRHTAASYAAMEGATLAELAGILGHRQLSMVKRYSHLSPDHVAKASTNIGRRVMGGADE